MPRTPSVRYFTSRGAYYTQYRGRQHCLATGPKDEPDGPTYKKAVEQFARLMHLNEAEKLEDDSTVSAIISRHKQHLHNQGQARTVDILERALTSAVEDFGAVRVRDLKTHHVQSWLDRMGQYRGLSSSKRPLKWGGTMKRMALDRLTAALNWSVDQGLITKNPIRVSKLGLRRRASRGREYVLRPGEHDRARDAAKPWFRDLLDFLEGTGCRPGEAYHVEAKHYDPEQQLIRFRWDAEPPEYVHKTARRTQKDRVILLAPAMVEIVERLVKRHATGRLFRNRDRQPWTNSAVHLYLKRLTKRLGLSSHFVAYSYRHTFATNWLLAGGSIKVLAELLGNSVAMLEKHYSHLEIDPAALRRLLVQFRQGAGGGPAGSQDERVSR